eukprot:3449876-Alexandrium_andersonii.AAC.1
MSGVLQDSSGFLSYWFGKLHPEDLNKFQAQAGGPQFNTVGGSGRAGQPPGLENTVRSQHASVGEFRQPRRAGGSAATLHTIRGTQHHISGVRLGRCARSVSIGTAQAHTGCIQ